MKKLLPLLLLMLLPVASLAGSRGLDIAFLDATPSNTTKEGKRLAELLVMDMKKLYSGDQIGKLFSWSENKISVKAFSASNSGLSFDRLLNTKDAKKIDPLLAKHRVSDGLVVFYYDRANGHARLKLYGSQGEELLLLRLPLEGKNSAMKYSLMKGNRIGALAAIGANVRWNP
ncbi:MAG: hypothetical protein AB8F34_13855 [Akkermansiaceae bacterium]